MHAQINRVGGVLEVKVVVKEKLDALEGGVQHILGLINLENLKLVHCDHTIHS